MEHYVNRKVIFVVVVFKEHINTWKMSVSRRNRTRLIFILVYLTVIIY